MCSSKHIQHTLIYPHARALCADAKLLCQCAISVSQLKHFGNSIKSFCASRRQFKNQRFLCYLSIPGTEAPDATELLCLWYISLKMGSEMGRNYCLSSIIIEPITVMHIHGNSYMRLYDHFTPLPPWLYRTRAHAHLKRHTPLMRRINVGILGWKYFWLGSNLPIGPPLPSAPHYELFFVWIQAR